MILLNKIPEKPNHKSSFHKIQYQIISNKFIFIKSFQVKAFKKIKIKIYFLYDI